MKQARLEIRLEEQDKELLKIKANNAEKSLSSYCLEKLFLSKELLTKEDKQTLKNILQKQKKYRARNTTRAHKQTL